MDATSRHSPESLVDNRRSSGSFLSADGSASGEDSRGEDRSIDSDNCLRFHFDRSVSAEFGDIKRCQDKLGDERGFRNLSALISYP